MGHAGQFLPLGVAGSLQRSVAMLTRISVNERVVDPFSDPIFLPRKALQPPTVSRQILTTKGGFINFYFQGLQRN
jgi:hypothetical protein